MSASAIQVVTFSHITGWAVGDRGHRQDVMLPRSISSQHPDEHRPERPVLLAVDQQLGEGAGA